MRLMHACGAKRSLVDGGDDAQTVFHLLRETSRWTAIGLQRATTIGPGWTTGRCAPGKACRGTSASRPWGMSGRHGGIGSGCSGYAGNWGRRLAAPTGANRKAGRAGPTESGRPRRRPGPSHLITWAASAARRTPWRGPPPVSRAPLVGATQASRVSRPRRRRTAPPARCGRGRAPPSRAASGSRSASPDTAAPAQGCASSTGHRRSGWPGGRSRWRSP